MSDRTWYLFGETLKAELKDLVRQQRSWYETEKELAEQGFHSDGHEDFEEKKNTGKLIWTDILLSVMMQ